jgi:Protein of unknown function (DUF3592)
MKSDVWLLLFSFAAVFAIMTGPRIWRALRFSSSASWPTLPATVEQVLVHSDRGRIGRTYRAEILYSYQESGKYYSGSYIGPLCLSEDEANLLVDAYPKGTILQVHVHPTMPTFSVANL